MCRAPVVVAALLIASACAAAEPQPAPEPSPLFRWQPPLFRWHYNPAHAPAWLSAQEAQAMVERAVNGWRACAVAIEFEGITDRVPGRMDGVNVIGWKHDLAAAQRGVTSGRTRRDGSIVERDVAVGSGREEFLRHPRLMEKVIAHETGHALGLLHAHGCVDLMSYGGRCSSVAPDDLPVDPTPGDLAACRERYGVKP